MTPSSEQQALTLRDLEIAKRELEGVPQEQIAEEVGVCRKTVHNTKAKPAYRDLMLSALENNKFGVNDLAKKLVELVDARKSLNVDGQIHIVEDNVTMLGAARKLCDILGVDAPKELDIKASTANMTNEELARGLSDELNTRQEQIKGALANGLTDTETGQDEGGNASVS
jgi:transcriptional regulator with XRE-family HTH domain